MHLKICAKMEASNSIVLFDGECNFCSFWVRYVIKRDGKGVFRFASLQSAIGKALLLKYQVAPGLDSVVLIENKNVYIKSTAAFRILKTLGGFLSFFYVFIVIPKFIRDFFYDLVASIRYRISGKGTCKLPTNANDSERFL
jgi:predicted DCC family thiol-disulfide oxidoreductase YuxK